MASRTKPAKAKTVSDYRHDAAKRLNNPTAALAREDVAPAPQRTFSFSPHLPPELIWAGKAEEPEFAVEAPSIHVHERLSTEAILKAAQRESPQIALFADTELDRAQQVAFFKRKVVWENRLILGDSLIVMTSLLEHERLAGEVRMVYIDPPYGINYRSNFQPRISDRNPAPNRDESLTRDPEQIQAYRDTWQYDIHSYLTYLRQRLLVARELLSEDGSIFLQIGNDNVHRVRAVLDEVFHSDNSIAMISMQKSGGSTTTALPEVVDYILWYAKDLARFKTRFQPLYEPFDLRNLDTRNYRWVEAPDGSRRAMTKEERENPASIGPQLRPFRHVTATSQDPSTTRSGPYVYDGKTYYPDKFGGTKRHWSVAVPQGLDRLAERNRLEASGETLQIIRYLDDFPVELMSNIWLDTGRSGFGEEQRYVVQTNSKAIERCILMATEPGDLVLDPTCGSGTTAWTAEKHGRRWITIDTSRVALAVARERILTAKFDYYKLRDPNGGVDSGLVYETVRRVQPGDLAEDREPVECHYATAHRSISRGFVFLGLLR